MVISPLNIGIYTSKKNWDFTTVTSWVVLSYMYVLLYNAQSFDLS